MTTAAPSAVLPQRVHSLAACPSCGLVQQLPEVPDGYRAVCDRCDTILMKSGERWRSGRATAALAAAALILYPPAILLPVLQIRKLGHSVEDSVVTGVVTLLTGGHFFVGVIVLVFSLIVPPLKLIALLTLATSRRLLGNASRAFTFRVVEALGRWGMLDVLVVAVLIAYVKLGDSVTIAPGPGLTAFAGCVLLSLLSSVCFAPRLLWKEHR